VPTQLPPSAERTRLLEDAQREKNWKRWGPYLSERQWGTVREDYSADGSCWDYFPHDHARSRAYRWGEDGILGLCDREGRLCFAVALWNGRDPILKERLFGLAGPEGNHGEDVKECYFYLDSTPTHSYMKALYRYPQAEFPYAHLVDENRKRGKQDPEYEILDTGIFNDGRYFDVTMEYAKAGPGDILIRITVRNQGPENATVHLLPSLWFRNTWSWGRAGEGYWPEPSLKLAGQNRVLAQHASLGTVQWDFEPGAEIFFTANETNHQHLYGTPNGKPYVKDAFHDYVIHGKRNAVNPANEGTKAAAYYHFELGPGKDRVIQLRLCEGSSQGMATDFDQVFADRIQEADEFYGTMPAVAEPSRRIMRQACAGLLWTKQFYHYSVEQWLDGDPAQPTPPPSRRNVRNQDWTHLYNRDVISMPDSWEYPWYAAWDLAFHMIPLAHLDPHFAKEQLILMLREWYMHPSGQIPAYEFAFSDVNPPVHAWACWRVYKMTGRRGHRDHSFLARAFQKLLINFTWWVNRKDVKGNHLFSGGFLGLDNIGVFDRSKPLPGGYFLEQADGTAWMAFYCATMLSMALELAATDPAYEDVASKFFEHFVAIADAMNSLGGTGLWDETDGFYYDQIHVDGQVTPVRVRSMVGVMPLFAAEVLDQETLKRLPGFSKRMEWFLKNRRDLAKQISYAETAGENPRAYRLLAIPSRSRLERVLRRVLDPKEFLSPYGVRSLSRVHAEQPFTLQFEGNDYRVDYEPGESTTGLFGGNSNWRGPIWFPVNYLLIEALERYHHYYGDTLKVECPVGSGVMMNLQEVSCELSNRLAAIFMPDAKGRAAWHGDMSVFASDPRWRDLTWFYEYFHGDNGRGCGASHQTGWTALVVRCLSNVR
jgi:hypothetical protein